MLDPSSSPTAGLEAAQILTPRGWDHPPLPDPRYLWPGMFSARLQHHLFLCLETRVPFSNKCAVLVFHFASRQGFGANQFISTAPGRGCGTRSRTWGYCNWTWGKPPPPFPLSLALFSYLCSPRLPHNFTQTRGPVRPTYSLCWLSCPASPKDGAGAGSCRAARVRQL